MSNDDRFQLTRQRLGHIDPVRPNGLLFLPFRQVDDVLYLSGELPFLGTAIPNEFQGKVTNGVGVDVATAIRAAGVTTLNLLFSAKAALGKLDHVLRVIEAFGVINSADGFSNQSAVMNGCSSVLLEVFGSEKGGHTRCAIGVSELPLNACIEIKLNLHIDCAGLADNRLDLRGRS